MQTFEKTVQQIKPGGKVMLKRNENYGIPLERFIKRNRHIYMTAAELAEVCQKKKFVVLVSRNDKENSEYAAEVCEYVKQNNSNDILYFSLKLESGEFKSVHPELTVEVNDTPALSIDELENIVKSKNNSSKMSMIVIDHLWLMATQNTYTTKKEESEEILSKIKRLVKQEKITVLALVLLSKYASKNYSVRKELESYGNFIRWADFIVKSSSEI